MFNVLSEAATSGEYRPVSFHGNLLRLCPECLGGSTFVLPFLSVNGWTEGGQVHGRRQACLTFLRSETRSLDQTGLYWTLTVLKS